MHNWDTYGEFWNLCLKRPLKARQLHTGLLIDKYNFPLKRFKSFLKLLCFGFLYIINFLPSNGFYLFWKFSKETFLFLCWLWPEMGIKEIKMLFWVFFFLSSIYLLTYLFLIYTVYQVCAHQDTFIEHLLHTVFSPTYFEVTNRSLLLSRK